MGERDSLSPIHSYIYSLSISEHLTESEAGLSPRRSQHATGRTVSEEVTAVLVGTGSVSVGTLVGTLSESWLAALLLW